jgi:hypothetical protein
MTTPSLEKKPGRPASPSRPRQPRTPGGATLAQDHTREAKRLAAALLEVLAGVRTPTEAATALGLSLPRYYQLEGRALRGLLEACEPKPKGRQPSAERELAALRRDKERLGRELARQQTLVRLAQRNIGLAPPGPPTAASAKSNGKKTRRRQPKARALQVAARLQAEPVPQLPDSLQQLQDT